MKLEWLGTAVVFISLAGCASSPALRGAQYVGCYVIHMANPTAIEGLAVDVPPIISVVRLDLVQHVVSGAIEYAAWNADLLRDTSDTRGRAGVRPTWTVHNDSLYVRWYSAFWGREVLLAEGNGELRGRVLHWSDIQEDFYGPAWAEPVAFSRTCRLYGSAVCGPGST